MTRIPAAPFVHLDRLTDSLGLFEHAWGIEPRVAAGYTTDDVGRALVRVSLEPQRSEVLDRLEAVYVGFLESASTTRGRFHNRRAGGEESGWLDSAGSDDASARAIRGLAAASVHSVHPGTREAALRVFHDACCFESRWERANANLALAGADVLAARRADPRARRLLERAARSLRPVSTDRMWPWPEARLAYENALLAEARIAAGAALRDHGLLGDGLRLLEWLEATEMGRDHFSFTPVGGRGRGDPRPAFDQQPIEAGAMATACATAYRVTRERRWAEACVLAACWFLGENDAELPLLDGWSGGCHDGLGAHGVNANEGAESTIAMIAALQEARWVQAAAARAASSPWVSTVAAPT